MGLAAPVLLYQNQFVSWLDKNDHQAGVKIKNMHSFDSTPLKLETERATIEQIVQIAKTSTTPNGWEKSLIHSIIQVCRRNFHKAPRKSFSQNQSSFKVPLPPPPHREMEELFLEALLEDQPPWRRKAPSRESFWMDEDRWRQLLKCNWLPNFFMKDFLKQS